MKGNERTLLNETRILEDVIEYKDRRERKILI